MDFIDLNHFKKFMDEIPDCEYINYLKDIYYEIAEGKQHIGIERLQP